VDRQIDWRHAALVERVVAILVEEGWQTHPEWSFNHFGDRGSVDVLAWHPAAGALLVIEVKSDLRDVQETLRSLNVKRRVVPSLAERSPIGRARVVGVVMVLADLRCERDRVARHRATFDAALPARTVEVKRWVAAPEADLRGIWFLQIPRTALLAQKGGARERVRRHPGVPTERRR